MAIRRAKHADTTVDDTRATGRGTHADDRVVHDDPALRGEHRVVDESAARDRFGGANLGAAFFGWMVAIGMTVLLTGIVAAAATAVGYSQGVTQTDAERQAGGATLVTALVVLAILVLAYYAGGYVAGRMSRFDGGRQGLAVWVIGLLVTILAVVLGAVAGDQYNVLDRVAVPRLPIPTSDATLAGIVLAVAVLLGTLFAAMLGGKLGRRYHRRVDRAALVR